MVTEDGTVRSKRSRPGAIGGEEGGPSSPAALTVDPARVPLPTDDADVARESSPSAPPLTPAIERSVREVTGGVHQVELGDEGATAAREPSQPAPSLLEAKEQHAAQSEGAPAVAAEPSVSVESQEKGESGVHKDVVDGTESPSELTGAASPVVVSATQNVDEAAPSIAEATPAGADDVATEDVVDSGAISLPTPPKEAVKDRLPRAEESSEHDGRVPSSASPEPMSKQD